jgi:hypothetical protein
MKSKPMNDATIHDAAVLREVVTPMVPASKPSPDTGYNSPTPEPPGLPSHGLARPFHIKRRRRILPGYRF